jgi:hypothetical protein
MVHEKPAPTDAEDSDRKDKTVDHDLTIRDVADHIVDYIDSNNLVCLWPSVLLFDAEVYW